MPNPRRLLRQMFTSGASSPQGALPEILRGALLALTVQAVGVSLSYGSQIALARWLGPYEFGRFSYAIAGVSLIAVIAGMGMNVAALGFLPRYIAEGDNPLARGFSVFSARFVVKAGLGFALLLAVAGFWFGMHGWQYGYPLAFAGWAIPFIALIALRSSIARGLGHVALAYAPQQILRPAALTTFAAVALLLRRHLGAEEAILSALASYGIVALVQNQLVQKKLRQVVGNGVPAFRRRAWINVAIPLLLVSGSLVIMNQADLLMVGAILGPTQAGIYSVAARLASVVGLVLFGINVLAAPEYARLHDAGATSELQSLARRLGNAVFWPSILVALLLLLFGRFALGLFGSGYRSGWDLLAILVVGQVVSAGAGSVGYLTELTGHHQAAARVRVIGALLNVLLNALLIPTVGAVGAAIATSTTLTVWNVWLHRIVARRVGVDASVLSNFRRR